eukprot:tig00021133_g18920.t1
MLGNNEASPALQITWRQISGPQDISAQLAASNQAQLSVDAASAFDVSVPLSSSLRNGTYVLELTVVDVFNYETKLQVELIVDPPPSPSVAASNSGERCDVKAEDAFVILS